MVQQNIEKMEIRTFKGKEMHSTIEGLFLGGIWDNKDEFSIDDEKTYVVEYETRVDGSNINGVAYLHNTITRCREIGYAESQLATALTDSWPLDEIDKYLLDKFGIVGGACSSQMCAAYNIARGIMERLYINNENLNLD